MSDPEIIALPPSPPTIIVPGGNTTTIITPGARTTVVRTPTSPTTTIVAPTTVISPITETPGPIPTSIVQTPPAGPRGPQGPSAQPSVTLLVTDPQGAVLDDPTLDLEGILVWPVPVVLDGALFDYVVAHVTDPSTVGSVVVQIHNTTTGFDVLSTPLSIDVNEKDSMTAAPPAVINPAHQVVSTADEIRIDIDTPGIGARGLSVEIGFSLP